MTLEDQLMKQIRIKYPALTTCKYKLQQLSELWEREYSKWVGEISEERLAEFEQSRPVVNIRIFLKIE